MSPWISRILEEPSRARRAAACLLLASTVILPSPHALAEEDLQASAAQTAGGSAFRQGRLAQCK